MTINDEEKKLAEEFYLTSQKLNLLEAITPSQEAVKDSKKLMERARQYLASKKSSDNNFESSLNSLLSNAQKNNLFPESLEPEEILNSVKSAEDMYKNKQPL